MIGLLQAVVLPSGFATLLFLMGLTAMIWRRSRSMAWPLLACAGAVLLIFSNGLVATLLSSPLEYAYPMLKDPRQHPDASVIVVLTGYAANDQNMPLSAKMNAASAFRVLEAVNLHRSRPDCQLVVSGSATAARVMGLQLRTLGVPDNHLVLDVMSNNTSASAEHIQAIVGGRPLFLVTSAGHMKRSVGVFRRHGMAPIPVPTDHRLPKDVWNASWTTSPIHLEASDLAVHEYIGLWWYRLTDRL